jgi:hypothetical protein
VSRFSLWEGEAQNASLLLEFPVSNQHLAASTTILPKMAVQYIHDRCYTHGAALFSAATGLESNGPVLRFFLNLPSDYRLIE